MMSKYARINDRKVVELFETDLNIKDIFHQDLAWVEIKKADGAVSVGWSYDGKFSQPPIKTTEPDAVSIDTEKRVMYREEADPLFFKYQRGEIDKQEWLDKVEEIKARFN